MRHLALLFALAPTLAIARQVPAPVAPQVPHERVLPLQGGQNFRDLGGYRTADGRTVKWGLLYRSGAMNALTPADFAALAKRGLVTVCDLRDTRERAKAPVANADYSFAWLMQQPSPSKKASAIFPWESMSSSTRTTSMPAMWACTPKISCTTSTTCWCSCTCTYSSSTATTTRTK